MARCLILSRLLVATLVLVVLVVSGCCSIKAPTNDTAPSVAEAERFMKQVEQELLQLLTYQSQANWVRESYITDDTEALGARANEEVMEFMARKSAEAAAFNALLAQMPLDLQRKMEFLKTNLDMPAPIDLNKRQELAKISTSMDSLYGKGKYCSKRLNQCLDLEQITALFAKNRNYDDLLDLWQGWHLVGRPMRESYQRFVELSNLGARELGYAQLADVWNSRYDMPPARFEEELDRLWQQVQPLYLALHCYVRSRLSALYGPDRVPPGKPIPMHVLGNLWAQEWNNLYELVAPEPQSANAIEIEKSLKARNTDERQMVRFGEAFFTSLGLDPLPKSFWERSLFAKPKDREVICHASAWDVDQSADIRIKMCIQPNDEDFGTIHHELGHNYYQYAYRNRDLLFRESANDGFHEALGDLVGLSMTPGYLKKIGLISDAPAGNLNQLMKLALDRIAFLPWGLLVDRWRWGVFKGEIKPENYNRAWWELRRKYQGVESVLPRTEEDFDPGAKYHIASNTPYTRYFLANILQFQFHRGLCKLAGHQGSLDSCSLYGNKDIGSRLQSMMEMGRSKPWPEALKSLTGEDRMDASAIVEYFAPLLTWLQEQNKGQQCGW